MKRWYGLIAFAIALAMLGVMACGGDDEDEDEDEDETPVPLPTAPPAVVQPPAVAAPTAAPVAAVAPVPTVGPAPVAMTEKPGGTLRWFMNATIPNLDSVRSTAYTTWVNTSQIYDPLFGWNLKKETKPQLVDTWTIDSDAKNYTFTLRDGPTFHDGSPVTAQDAAAAIKRWLSSVGGGRVFKIAGGVDAQAVDSKTFALQVGTETGDPFGLWVVYWGRGHTQVYPQKAVEGLGEEEIITDMTGSGPRKFISWHPGDRVLLQKYDGYVGRSEPHSANTGDRTSLLDFVEIFEIPDPAARMAALQTRQADFADFMPGDYYGTALRSEGLEVDIITEFQRSMIATNKTQAPLGGPGSAKVLLAIQLAVDQERWATAMHGDKSLWRLCAAQYHCDGPFASDAGDDTYRAYDLDEAKRLWNEGIAEAGFTGKMVILANLDRPEHIAGSLLLREMMDAFGADIEYASADWATTISRKIQNLNNPPEEGGWHFYMTSDSMWDPVQDDSVGTTWNGGYPNPQVHQMVKNFARSKTQAEAKAIVDEIQRIYYEDQPGNINLAYFNALVFRQDYVKGHVPHEQINIDAVWLAK